MRPSLVILIVALAGLFGGGVSAWYAIRHAEGFGAIKIGPWTAVPFASAEDVDPYVVAKSVVEGSVPLGITEGLAFSAYSDSEGSVLSLTCDYDISGNTPAAKLWTLVVYNASDKPVESEPGDVSATYSGAVVRFGDGSYRISLSRHAKPGNWLAVSGSGDFHLTLRLYDASISGNSQLDTLRMPTITRRECL
ncbi:MAG: DUF1214 domain-containing protein [Nitratireductor sp.]|nr:DUF1214 domain-containing protein [Nitratireductor sp.]